MKVTQEELAAMFEYKDGKLYWKISPSQNTKAGKEAGFKSLHNQFFRG